MSIREIAEKIKGGARERELDWFILASVLLVGILGYGLWRLAELEEGRAPVRIIEPALVSESLTPQRGEAVEGKYVASKSGAKYHLPWCAGAKRIKEENKVWFDTEEAAIAAGYTPAANCPGL